MKRGRPGSMTSGFMMAVLGGGFVVNWVALGADSGQWGRAAAISGTIWGSLAVAGVLLGGLGRVERRRAGREAPPGRWQHPAVQALMLYLVGIGPLAAGVWVSTGEARSAAGVGAVGLAVLLLALALRNRPPSS